MKLIAFNLSIIFGWPPLIRKIIMIINFTTILMIFALLQVSAEGYSQINLKKKNVSLESIFKSIESQTGYVFFSKDNDLKNKNIDIDVSNVSIESALDECFKNLPLTYKIVDKTVVIRRIKESKPESKIERNLAIPIKGKVTDEQGAPLPGVSVTVKGTTIGTVTNERGEYNFDVSDGNAIIVFSFIGFVPQQIALNGQNQLSVTMVEDLAKLDEVVVVGYGTQKKVNLTGSVSVVKGEDLVRRPVGQTSAALQGAAPGLTVRQQSGQPGRDNGNLLIRGVGTLGNGMGPLVLVDGVETSIDNV